MSNQSIGLMSRMFANGPGDQGSKTQKKKKKKQKKKGT